MKGLNLCGGEYNGIKGTQCPPPRSNNDAGRAIEQRPYWVERESALAVLAGAAEFGVTVILST